MSTGHYLPKKAISNEELSKTVDTSDEWIIKRTGIKSRHIANDKESTSYMAISAGRQALENARLDACDIDGIIVATTTPDRTFPATAALVQAGLGIPPCPAFDVQAVCSGFIYALANGDALIAAGMMSRVLVIGVDKFSALLDWNDRTTCVLFGDGAGAVILEKSDNNSILAINLYADGSKAGILTADGGVGSDSRIGKIVMQGQDVFKEAVKCISSSAAQALEAAGLGVDDIDLFIPHQANMRIIEAVAKRLNMPMERIAKTIETHGNTSAASIPLALHSAILGGETKKGDTILMTAMGAGLTWGSVIVKL